MAIAFVQSATAQSAVASGAPAISLSNVVEGNFVCIAISAGTSVPATDVAFSDTQTNTWNTAFKTNNGNNQECLILGYAMLKASGSLTVTCTLNSSLKYAIIIREYSGFDNKAHLDKFAINTGSGTTLAATTTATTSANQLVIGVGGSPQAVTNEPTISSGFSNFVNSVSTAILSISSSDKIVAAVGTQAATAGQAVSGFIGTGVATFSSTLLPTTLNNYQQLKVGDGMSTSEKIR